MSDKPAPTGQSVLNAALGEVTEPATPPADPAATPAPDPATPPADPAATPPAPADPPADQAVPYDRFKEVNDQLRAEREKNAEYERQQEAARVAQLSEKEQAEERARKAEADAAAAKERADKLERDSWITAMAAAMNFADPADAVALIDPKDAGDQAAAQEAVKQLAASKPHLIKQGTPQPQRLGTPGVGHQQQPAPGSGGDPEDAALQTGKDLLGLLTGRRG